MLNTPPSPLRMYRRQSCTKRGQTLVEYALTISFVSVVAIGVLAAMGGNVKGAFSTINSQLSSATNGGAGSPAGGGGGGGRGG